MIVIAHRGASGYAPEHTFASWDLAARMGADYLEQDLQMTRDGVLIVMHDETLNRTMRRNGAPCTGRVVDHTLAELRECEVGSWYSPEFAGERVPTLEEVFKRYPDANLYIETKKPEEAPGMEEKLLALLDAYGLSEPAATGWRVLVQSFSEASLRKMHAMNPRLPLIQLMHRGAVDRDGADPDALGSYMRAVSDYAVGVGPHYSDVDVAFVDAAHAACLHVHPYTVDDEAVMRRLEENGVDGMFTNFPDKLLGFRPASELRGAAALQAAADGWRRCRELRGKGRRTSPVS